MELPNNQIKTGVVAKIFIREVRKYLCFYFDLEPGFHVA